MSDRTVHVASNGTLYWDYGADYYLRSLRSRWQVMSRQEAENYRDGLTEETSMDQSKYPLRNQYSHQGRWPLRWHNGSTGEIHIQYVNHGAWAIEGSYVELVKQEEKERNLSVSDVSKVLSNAVIVSSTLFAKLTPAKQTEVLVTTAGKPVIFVGDFDELRNRKAIIKKLLSGEDVTVELEFNDIELTDDEKKVVQDVQPILKKFDALKPVYPWVTPSVDEEYRISKLQYRERRVYNDSGYYVTEAQAKKIWQKASLAWASGTTVPAYYETVGGHNNKVITITPSQVTVGCQTASRAEIEAVAKHFGWEPKLPEDK